MEYHLDILLLHTKYWTLQISECPNFLKPYNLRIRDKSEIPKLSLINYKIEKEQENETETEIVIDQADFYSFYHAKFI